MKVAVLADIHGNWAALEAVLADLATWQPDQVVVAGDVVNRGPESPRCLAYVYEQVQNAGWLWVRGNHEDYMLAHAMPAKPLTAAQQAVYQIAHWIYHHQLGASAVPILQSMPFAQHIIAPDSSLLRVVHASVKHNRAGIFPETPESELAELVTSSAYPSPAALVVAHTHRPLLRQHGQTLLVNTGAVGMPFDSNPRASYARLIWQANIGWSARVVRLIYDRAATRRAFTTSGLLDAGGPTAQIILREFEWAASLLSVWAHQYEAAALAGQIDLHDSVTHFLTHW